MKKTLFLGALLLAGTASAQFTQTNAPQVGESIKLYVVDSAATPYANITGTNVTWDYSNLTSYNGAMKTIKVIDPAQSTYSSDFGTNSDYAISVEGVYMHFLNVSAQPTKKMAEGAVYADSTGTSIVLKLGQQPAELMDFPFDVGDNASSTVSGNADVDYNGQVFTAPATGHFTSTVDGSGTLILPSGNEYTNVMRLKTEDTTTINSPLGIFNVYHIMYRYFDMGISHLPIFRYEHLVIIQQGSTVPTREYHLALSLDNENTSSIGFTNANAPAIGDNMNMYVVDSSATPYDNVTGANASWDYSNVTTVGSLTKMVKVVDPASTSYASTFGNNSDYAIDVQDLMTTFTNTSTFGKRIGEGMVYNYVDGPDHGTILLNLDSIPGTYYSYPMSLGQSISDSIFGTSTLDYNNGTLNSTSAAVGVYHASVDGQGTLTLLSGIQYNNVVRYKLVDTISFNTPLGQYITYHKSYEYYDFTVSNLPIFTYTHVWFGPLGGSPKVEYSLLLSKDNSTTAVNTENPLAEVKLYPNPTRSELNMSLPNDIQKANVQIIDGLGKVVATSATQNGKISMNVSYLKQGVYHVRIAANNAIITKSLMIK